MLNWCARFNIFCFLDNHAYQLKGHQYECILAAGAYRQWEGVKGNEVFDEVSHFLSEGPNQWYFGHLAYELAGEIEPISFKHEDPIGFPLISFFIPSHLIFLNDSQLRIMSYDPSPQKLFEAIASSNDEISPVHPQLNIQVKIDRIKYIEKIEALRAHILRGDCYEINFCQEFFNENALVDPLSVYYGLSEQSPNPFSAFYRLDDRYLICASPERYLKRSGNTILSQPIKGTSRRYPENRQADEQSRDQLSNSGKDRSENVMVVDLVRNDLSKICVPGSVQVDELFGIYSFPQVHQMISTVSGTLRADIDFAGIIQATFPMGSMTGAPKKRVMELIAQYEEGARGLYSGAVGYIDPEGGFDFNVVIRSILYNAAIRYLSFQVGSGITYYSDAQQEYEECLLKAAAMRRILSQEKSHPGEDGLYSY